MRSWRPRAAAGTCVKTSLAKATVHEAVDQGVDAGRGIAQQVDERDGCAGKCAVGTRAIEGTPCVGAVHWQPTQEKKHNNHQQHPHHTLLRQQLGLGGPGAGPWSSSGRGQRRQLQCSPGARKLHVTTIAILASQPSLRPATPVWMDRT